MQIQLKEIADNINAIGWKALDLLRNNQLSFLKLKGELGLSQEKTYKELAKLEGALLITASRGIEDQRVILYSLTKYGEEILKFKE